MQVGLGPASTQASSRGQEGQAKRPRVLGAHLQPRWRAFADELAAARRIAQAAETGFAFHFVEGALVAAMQEGHWLLLDEVNLAPPQVCPCCSLLC